MADTHDTQARRRIPVALVQHPWPTERFAVDAEYRRQARPPAAERMALAGVRLANPLNSAPQVS